MSMPIAQAQQILERAIERMQSMTGPSTLIVVGLRDVATACLELKTGGYQQNVIGSTVHLANEIVRVQEQQQARMAALLAGLRELR